MFLKPVKNAENGKEADYPSLLEHRRRRAAWLKRLAWAGGLGGLVLAAGGLAGDLAAGDDPSAPPPEAVRLRGDMAQPAPPGGIRPVTPPTAKPEATPTPVAEPEESKPKEEKKPDPVPNPEKVLIPMPLRPNTQLLGLNGRAPAPAELPGEEEQVG